MVPGGSSPKRIDRSRAAPISSAFVVSASSIARISAISDPGYPNPPFLWASLVWLGSESRPWHRGGSTHEDSHDRDPNRPRGRDRARDRGRRLRRIQLRRGQRRKQRETPRAQPQYGGSVVIDRVADSQSMDKTTVFDNESIWVFEQIMEPLYTVSKDGKDVVAVARDLLHALARQEDLHVQAPAGRQVLERPANDLGRRQVLDRRGPGRGPGLGIPRRRDQGHRDSRSRDGRDPHQVPVVAVPGRHRALRQRHHPEGLRRRDQEGVLHAPGRHRPVHVGPLGQGQRARPQEEPQLLAEGQAVPRQRHVANGRRRQHP